MTVELVYISPEVKCSRCTKLRSPTYGVIRFPLFCNVWQQNDGSKLYRWNTYSSDSCGWCSSDWNKGQFWDIDEKGLKNQWKKSVYWVFMNTCEYGTNKAMTIGEKTSSMIKLEEEILLRTYGKHQYLQDSISTKWRGWIHNWLLSSGLGLAWYELSQNRTHPREQHWKELMSMFKLRLWIDKVNADCGWIF